MLEEENQPYRKIVDKHYTNFERQVMKHPPKQGLKYLTGFWKVPWIILPKWFSFKQMDRVKMKVANKPKGDIACAYVLGLLDAQDGKHRGKYLGSNATEVLEVTPEWFVKFSYEIPEEYKLKEGKYDA